MAEVAARILVAQVARVFLAPVGTAAPADSIVALDPLWLEVGFFTPSSLQFTTAPTFAEVMSHQSNYPTRRMQTADAATLEVDLQEWSGKSFSAVYGGGTITQTGTTPNFTYKYSPPAIGTRINIAALVEIVDGTKHYRRIIPKCFQTEGVQTQFQKASETTMPLRLSVVGSDVGDAFYDMTDDPAFASLVV